MSELGFHPLANIFPLLSGEEFEALAADIRTYGVREPVVLYEGAILDGRNRYRASLSVGVDCPLTLYEGDDALAYVISQNMHKRNLSFNQRAMAAANVQEILISRKKKKRDEKRNWIALARMSLVSGDREPCTICGCYSCVAEAHHVLPLSIQFDHGFSTPDHEIQWLCPTHHRLVHEYIDALTQNRQPYVNGIDPDERDALASLTVRFVKKLTAAEGASSSEAAA